MKIRHAGDCDIYASLCNGRPYDGLCTRGYGSDYRYHQGGDGVPLMGKERVDRDNQ